MTDKTMPVRCWYCGGQYDAPAADRRLWIGTSAVRYLLGVWRARAAERLAKIGGAR